MSSELPSTMRAWVYRTKGLPSEILKLEINIETPKIANLAPDEVLVEVYYSALNNISTQLMQTLRPRPLGFFISQKNRLAIPEIELGGRLIAAGKNVLSRRPDLKLGDLVIGLTDPAKSMRDGSGALAEYAVLPVAHVVPYQLPSGEQEQLSLAEWSALGGVGCTAIQVTERAGLKAGDKILVNGSSGGAGTTVIQVARYILGPSGHIVATCSASNIDLVKSLGADEVIDYQQCGPLHTYLAMSVHAQTPFDAIIDCVGIQDLFIHSPTYLALGKNFINIGSLELEHSIKGTLHWVWLAFWNQYCPLIFGGIPRHFEFYSAEPDVQSLEKLRKLTQERKLRPVVDSVWEFEDASKAYQIMENKRAKGKIVIRVKASD
ncbi:uncharacterized protein BHQ10_001503 [Talaromyces amestolkiae]|uniref:Enoyl reductase (ER) domain-containing protein n=1 Tax=Talaromyces amestolkiae TaxID=1196081 RepID=A0A364KPQ2_TALAM|nr:uncharacterized protein BHQ10_001503 [Talaromyces amestolkiae]RAO65491.1 hypothetical protein BHQ10_001503 [Talaromyces amestolkiae]